MSFCFFMIIIYEVKFGAKRDIVDEKGKTALQTACQLEFLQVANTLLITPNYADRNQFIERVVDVLYKDMGFMGNSMFVSRYTKAEILSVTNCISILPLFGRLNNIFHVQHKTNFGIDKPLKTLFGIDKPLKSCFGIDKIMILYNVTA